MDLNQRNLTCFKEAKEPEKGGGDKNKFQA
jgi:hypothetical protein